MTMSNASRPVVQITGGTTGLVVQLTESGIDPREIHALLTLLGDAITRRLIALVSSELDREGLALPSEGWCWVGFGSQARRERALRNEDLVKRIGK